RERERERERTGSLTSLYQLNSGSSDDDGGDGNKHDARDTSSMTAHNSNHSRVGTDNSRIRNKDSHSSRRIRSQPQPARLQPKHRRQNAARERKRIHLLPMQLREAFSSSLFYLPNRLTLVTES